MNFKHEQHGNRIFKLFTEEYLRNKELEPRTFYCSKTGTVRILITDIAARREAMLLSRKMAVKEDADFIGFASEAWIAAVTKEEFKDKGNYGPVADRANKREVLLMTIIEADGTGYIKYANIEEGKILNETEWSLTTDGFLLNIAPWRTGVLQ